MIIVKRPFELILTTSFKNGANPFKIGAITLTKRPEKLYQSLLLKFNHQRDNKEGTIASVIVKEEECPQSCQQN